MELAIVNRAAAVDVERFKECVAPDEGGNQCSSELIRGTQNVSKSASHLMREAISAHQSSSGALRTFQRVRRT